MKHLFHSHENVLCGLYPDGTTDEQYHGDITRDSFSLTEVFRRSIPEYHQRKNNTEPSEATDAMKFGSLLHCMVFEPTRFEDSYAVAEEDVNRTSKEGKAKWAQWKSEAGARELIKKKQFEQATALADCLYQDSFLRPLLEIEESLRELPIRWYHQGTGHAMRSKIDFFAVCPHTQDFIVIDLKTTSASDKREIANSVWGYGYHRQQACYTSALACALTGVSVREFTERLRFYFAFVKTDFPELQIVQLEPEYVDIGARQLNATIEELAYCHQVGLWRPRDDGKVIRLSPPRWSNEEFLEQ